MPAPDHAALHALYSEHNGWLKNWLRARLGNASDAADLAQDTFIRVLNARNADTIREPRSYLGAIAHALMIDKFRRKALEQAYLDELALRPERVAESPESRLLILEALLAVDQMLDGLGERTRTIFLTVQLEGLSYVATAERLGVSVTTVKKHLIRAMTHCLLLTDD
ncbi:sigma-70 family RNA polymerase sigma factor [Pseudomonas sp. SBB6]|uniref:sigma-70 family RNA polymerase sigma factor n=1 Tax=Pseudomonas sp. SBB6 TaxID=2962032 RepID=UPI0020B760F8|nr:sigma-70 family RNA polymerase sigma factor [Pseudomonas sp. SBB6]MCP3751723.1 sigma-70 family RNA polymerase sigma factor [Pseudomonas sp. SBB6]